MNKKPFLLILVVLVLLVSMLISGKHALADTFTIITPVSATADVNNGDASNTIDDNPNECNSPTYWQAAAENPAITYDLGEVMEVVGFRESAGPFPGNPFTAYVSTDGVTYIQVAADTLTSLWPTGDCASTDHLFTSPLSVRYIRLFVQRTNSTGYGELVDFRALGPESPGTPTAVTIDIEPGSDPNLVDPSSVKAIPVAILSTESFDATTVDPSSVEFGPNGTTTRNGSFLHLDVNNDSDLDLVLFFRPSASGIQCGDTSASLMGLTFAAQLITGSDTIDTSGC